MATSQPNSFERVFPRNRLLTSPARGVILWSVLAAGLLCVLLLLLYVVLDELTGTPVGDPATETYWPARMTAICRSSQLMTQDISALAILVVASAFIALARLLMNSRARSLSHHVGIDVATGLRRSIHRQRLRLGPGDLQGTQTEMVFGLFTREADTVRDAVSFWLSRIARFPLELIVLIALSIAIHPLVALQCLIPLSVCWILFRRELLRSGRAQRLLEDRSQSELRLLAESLRKTRLVRGYGMEAFEHEQFQKHLDRFRDSAASLKKGEGGTKLAGITLMLLGVALILYLTGIKVLLPAGHPSRLPLPGALVLWASFALMYRPLNEIRQIAGQKESGALAADRIYHYINRIPEVGQAVGAKFLQPLAKSIQFESVTFSPADGERLLDKLDLKLPAGGTTAVVSLNPLEARAFTYLLPRFIEPQSGRVLYDGEDIAWVTLESLRAETIYVGGDDPFFTGTVRENIACGNESYKLQDVTDAAKLSHAHGFILKLPSGYETVLGEHGEQLDAGESVRLGLARAILREPALMIIEEPLEKLDDSTKSLLDDAYTRIARNRTVLFLPSRLSTLRRVDNIVVLHEGKVEAVGPHADLVKNSQLYRHFEYSRFNEFARVKKQEN